MYQKLWLRMVGLWILALARPAILACPIGLGVDQQVALMIVSAC
jgi:hypothetical protein